MDIPHVSELYLLMHTWLYIAVLYVKCAIWTNYIGPAFNNPSVWALGSYLQGLTISTFYVELGIKFIVALVFILT
jgi:hypothetical protein